MMFAKHYRLLRYALLILQFSVLFREVTGASDLRLVLSLLIFINNQIRYYLWGNRLVLSLLSAAAELLFLMYWPFAEPFTLLFSLTPLMLDLAFLNVNGVPRYAILAVPTAYFILRAYTFSNFWWGLAAVVVITYVFYLLEQLSGSLAKAAASNLRAESDIQALQQDLKLRRNEIENREELVILRERNRISRDIHDSVGHGFSTISIQLSAIEKIAPSEPEQAASMAKALGEFSRDSLARIRQALRELKPQTYSAYETVLLLDDLCSKTAKLSNMAIHFRHTGNVRTIGEEQSQALYAITQEFLANSSRHGKAANIWIHLHFRDEELVYNLEDDGVGCPPDTPLGIGLRSMGERVRENHGTWLWQGQPGFRVKVILPLLLAADN